jgi:hypothetical protein
MMRCSASVSLPAMFAIAARLHNGRAFAAGTKE